MTAAAAAAAAAATAALGPSLKSICCPVFEGSVDLSLTADNKIVELYFDGKRVTVEDAEWTRVRKVSMPKRTRVIAIKCLDTGVSIVVVRCDSRRYRVDQPGFLGDGELAAFVFTFNSPVAASAASAVAAVAVRRTGGSSELRSDSLARLMSEEVCVHFSRASVLRGQSTVLESVSFPL
jgi:hypothetical protein